MTDTGRIDIRHEDANMYGCLDCPKCGDYHRVPWSADSRMTQEMRAVHGFDAPLGVIECLECKFVEPITEEVFHD